MFSGRVSRVLKGTSKTDSGVGLFDRVKEPLELDADDVSDAQRVRLIFKAWDSPFVFNAPAKKRATSSYSEVEWDEMWLNKVGGCSDEMFNVFYPNLRRIRTPEAIETDHVEEENWHWRRERHTAKVVHMGETVADYLARGGIVKIVPMSETPVYQTFGFGKRPNFSTFVASHTQNRV